MQKNVTVPCRFSKRMIRSLNEATAKQGVTRNEMLQNLVSHFILSPKFYDATERIELREPVTEIVTMTFDEKMVSVLQQMAKDHTISLSALLRMIVLVELTSIG